MARLVPALRAIGIRVAWLVIAIVVALGAAGIVAAGNHLPGTDARPEITWAADQAATRQLQASTAALQTLTDDVEKLGELGRLALTAVTARDLDRIDAAIADGTAFVATVEVDTASFRAQLGGVPAVGTNDAIRLSPAVRDRYDQLVTSVSLADSLAGQWRLFTRGAADATRLIRLLGTQDTEAAAAAKEGSSGRYPEAIDHIVLADAALAEAKTLRDRLANAADVTTLDRWLERNFAWNVALRELYSSLEKSGGRITDAIRDAFAKERKAFARLPADTKPLVIIMSDVAQGGLNQAVIAIEVARGSLEAALEPDDAVPDDGSGGPPAPTPPG